MRARSLSAHRGRRFAAVVGLIVAVFLVGEGVGARPAFADSSTGQGCVYNDGTLLGRSVYVIASVDTGTHMMNGSAESYWSEFPCTVPVPSNAIDVWMQAQVSSDQLTWTACDTKGPYVFNTVGEYWLASQPFNDCGHGRWYRSWVCGGVLDGGVWKTGCQISGAVYEF